MPDFRAYCTPPPDQSAEITLSPEESHHLVAVNRARCGDPIVAFDGCGTEWLCALSSAHKNGAVLSIRSTRRLPALPYEITLAQALPKGGTMDAIVRKATEIGAAQIIPIESDRTQVHLDGDRSEKKIEKWQTAALEAAKQCGNAFVPAVRPIQSAAALIQNSGDYDLKLVASLAPGARSLKRVLTDFAATHARPPKKVLWLVGPEGDFSPTELSAAQHHEFDAVTLGPLVLRCETAAIYALSILSYELQNPL
jgi:16S rRNA (uracil1498-N3)-methyltransferase